MAYEVLEIGGMGPGPFAGMTLAVLIRTLRSWEQLVNLANRRDLFFAGQLADPMSMGGSVHSVGDQFMPS